ncbi:uncharacterized protein LAESUDRAFT_813572 [Laetiporus sulphureus 93-53]|uniref:Uncharacterized protein n=1 Tax=Laetiporus sulphureus 93-53 TaxID=1314785 RepID=A0A165DRG7_9APHY|nr:uncharacterized protein LAESUDRAFT_813572 [Laetiporus sulphureus 93-53]KZT05473.1 hypothetical protein LAESUDRAFT_813572 [Laetiporus sulphureus 93-53]
MEKMPVRAPKDAQDYQKNKSKEDELKQAIANGETWKARAEQYEKELSAAQQRIEAATRELEETRVKNGKWTKEREEMHTLLEQRRIELEVAHTYLDSVDTVTEKDLVCSLGNLNAEIFQTVMSITESFATVEKNGLNEQIAEAALGIVGQKVFNALLSFPDHQLDPLLLEVALQVTIVRVMGWIIDAWDIEHWGSSVIARTYERMVSSENHRVAARWRMLAHKYQEPQPATGRQWEDDLTEKLQFCISAVFLVARGEYDPEKEEDNVRIIVRAALRVRKMIREDISSSDYQITVPVVGESFDPESMTDHYATKGSIPPVGARLLCPYELGLRRVDRREEDGTMVVRPVTLVRSKVLLESAINELVGSPVIGGYDVD